MTEFQTASRLTMSKLATTPLECRVCSTHRWKEASNHWRVKSSTIHEPLSSDARTTRIILCVCSSPIASLIERLNTVQKVFSCRTSAESERNEQWHPIFCYMFTFAEKSRVTWLHRSRGTNLLYIFPIHLISNKRLEQFFVRAIDQYFDKSLNTLKSSTPFHC